MYFGGHGAHPRDVVGPEALGKGVGLKEGGDDVAAH
jgi:hypothetical protein